LLSIQQCVLPSTERNKNHKIPERGQNFSNRAPLEHDNHMTDGWAKQFLKRWAPTFVNLWQRSHPRTENRRLVAGGYAMLQPPCRDGGSLWRYVNLKLMD